MVPYFFEQTPRWRLFETSWFLVISQFIIFQLTRNEHKMHTNYLHHIAKEAIVRVHQFVIFFTESNQHYIKSGAVFIWKIRYFRCTKQPYICNVKKIPAWHNLENSRYTGAELMEIFMLLMCLWLKNSRNKKYYFRHIDNVYFFQMKNITRKESLRQLGDKATH